MHSQLAGTFWHGYSIESSNQTGICYAVYQHSRTLSADNQLISRVSLLPETLLAYVAAAATTSVAGAGVRGSVILNGRYSALYAGGNDVPTSVSDYIVPCH